MRLKRAALDQATLTQNGRLLCQNIINSEMFQQAEHIAVYLPVLGEIDPTPLLKTAWARNKKTYLPVLMPDDNKTPLRFAPYHQHSQLKLNRFRIPEPNINKEDPFPIKNLHLVIAPLLAFDSKGTRLGMGGGYYDRTFAFLSDHRTAHPLKFLGAAHSLQQVNTLQRHSWDIPLDAIATENGLRFFTV